MKGAQHGVSWVNTQFLGAGQLACACFLYKDQHLMAVSIKYFIPAMPSTRFLCKLQDRSAFPELSGDHDCLQFPFCAWRFARGPGGQLGRCWVKRRKAGSECQACLTLLPSLLTMTPIFQTSQSLLFTSCGGLHGGACCPKAGLISRATPHP